MSEEIKMALVDRSRVVDERSLDRIIVSVCLPGLGNEEKHLKIQSEMVLSENLINITFSSCHLLFSLCSVVCHGWLRVGSHLLGQIEEEDGIFVWEQIDIRRRNHYAVIVHSYSVLVSLYFI